MVYGNCVHHAVSIMTFNPFELSIRINEFKLSQTIRSKYNDKLKSNNRNPQDKSTVNYKHWTVNSECLMNFTQLLLCHNLMARPFGKLNIFSEFGKKEVECWTTNNSLERGTIQKSETLEDGRKILKIRWLGVGHHFKH